MSERHILLQFNVYSVAHKVHFQSIATHESITGQEFGDGPIPLEIMGDDDADTWLYSDGLAVGVTGSSDWCKLPTSRQAAALVCDILDSCARIGDPDYAIALNHDQNKVFTVYLRDGGSA